ncbi:MAG TPA: endolytic transglycosylase MltG [Rhizomicrobium sp.]|nr:endolytic transglycosylase MltG [Rhizomicrobium sp.]
MTRFFAFLLLLTGSVAAAWLWEGWHFASPGPWARRGSETVIEIPSGEGLWRVASRLRNAGVIDNAPLFDIGVRLRRERGMLRAGEYAIPSRASMEDIAAILMVGRPIEHKVTAAEGLTSGMIAEIVNADPELTGPRETPPAEGTLLPETYFFNKGAARGSIIARMRVAQADFVSRAWVSRLPGLPFETPEQAVTLASIVEKETAIPEERRHIAAVFINRLRLGMKLESDPTVIYGISKGYPLGHGILASELSRPTPYNTYTIAGLPPTPICNPGKDAILAVLNPEHSADLYFVADGTGGHAFAASKSEHDRNVARWRKVESVSLRLKP